MSESHCNNSGSSQTDDCCGVKIKQEPAPNCPRCNKRGKPVSLVTIKSLLVSESARNVGSGPYYFCPTFSCPVVYFTKNDEQIFETSDLTVRVAHKDHSATTPICYCFHHTRKSIEDEIESTGKSTVIARITAEVQAGRCECETKNPQGTCCMGNVSRVVKDVMRGVNDFAKVE